MKSIREWVVVGILVLGLAAGWGLKTTIESAVTPFSQDGVAFSYPADWMRLPVFSFGDEIGEKVLFQAKEWTGQPGQPLQVRVTIQKQGFGVRQAQMADYFLGTGTLPAFRSLKSEAATVAGRPALVWEAVWAEVATDETAEPQLVRGQTVYVDSGGDLIRIKCLGDPSRRVDQNRALETVLKTLSLPEVQK